jgi:hypothetical protein
MDASDEKYVGECLRTLAAVHRVKYASDMWKGYWAGLQSMPRADFDRALKYLQEHAMWMPKPAEFRSAAKRGWQ